MTDRGHLPIVSIRALIRFTERLLDERALDRSLKIVTDSVLEQYPDAHHSSIRILDKEGDKLLSGARSGAGQNKPVTFKRGEGLAGWVIENEEQALVADTATDPRFVHKPGMGLVIRSIMIVPMLSPGAVLGVLGCTSRQADAFGEADITLLQLMANCASPWLLQARLRHLATTDELTNALNYRVLYPRLKSEIKVAQTHQTPLSLLLIDLDHFKDVNDTHGHAAGDAVLSTFADRVRSAIRQNDVFIRRGGEEFVVILPGAGTDGALHVAQRIRTALAGEFITLPGGATLAQTVSIGLASWLGDDDTAADLEGRADEAMYDAKRAGRNCVKLA